MESNLESLMRKLTDKLKEVDHSESYNESSKRRLIKILETKFKTCFIGAISFFEENFGSLWGHNKDRDDLTEDEKKWRKIWINVRANVLNNGNNQIRAVNNELNQYTTTWNRYEYDLIPKNLVTPKNED